MNRMVTYVPKMLLICAVGTGLVMPAAGAAAVLQSPGQSIHVVSGDVEAERGELQAPRAVWSEPAIRPSRAQDVQAPRADSVQAPRSEGVQAPGSKVTQAPHASEVKEPRWRED